MEQYAFILTLPWKGIGALNFWSKWTTFHLNLWRSKYFGGQINLSLSTFKKYFHCPKENPNNFLLCRGSSNFVLDPS